MLIINGAYGEGGGQIIRTAVTLATLLNQPLRLEQIRANRRNPGLAAQHLTAVRAAAEICGARLSGDTLGATQLEFHPGHPPQSGTYEFDVAEARPGGSAGAVTLILQTILLPLLAASGASQVTLRGGTHVPWSPAFPYIREVYLPSLTTLGWSAKADLVTSGWYPAGQGEIRLTLPGQAVPSSIDLPPFTGTHRLPLYQIRGLALAANLPAHIAQRLRDRAVKLLTAEGLPAEIEPQRVRAASPGAGLFLVTEYGDGLSRAGFSALGRKGKPAEQVAAEAVQSLLAFHHSHALCDAHLTDQILLPIALTGQPLTLAPPTLTPHTMTNLWVIRQFLGPVADVDHVRCLIHFHPREKLL